MGVAGLEMFICLTSGTVLVGSETIRVRYKLNLRIVIIA